MNIEKKYNSFYKKYFISDKIYIDIDMQFDKDEVEVYVEIEKHTNVKYEFNKETNQLEVDRILPYPFFYPYAYGFIPGTKAKDEDELDALIISDRPIKNDRVYKATVVGTLVMEDEKGLDEKILTVFSDENATDSINATMENDIRWFFSNYKNNTKRKWSIIHSFENKEKALELVEEYRLPENKLFNKNDFNQ